MASGHIHEGISTAGAQHGAAGGSNGERIRVRGLVQGVGFRPAVWSLACDCGLTGEVRNDAEGVLISAWGDAAELRRFLHRLQSEHPPLARIDSVECSPLAGQPAPGDFRIVASAGGEAHTAVVADAATCPRCLQEVFDPADRRYAHAFTNCTDCGPRLSIVERIPYDRGSTSMAAFDMCPACRSEYDDPADRRFHAQPNACPACGPRLWLEAAGDSDIDVWGEPIEAARRLLRAGLIVAVKGIGGVHLACDATNEEAVARLRRRKHRYDKPFALIARHADMVRRYCSMSRTEESVLAGSAAPIVLMEADGPERLAEAVAPGQCCYGFMLPYTPLHHLLMAGLEAPLVLTSGNRSEEPQCIGNRRARGRLSGIADALLLHDRGIVNRLDDSVVRVIAGAPALLRRARGYAPSPLRLPGGFGAAPPVLAHGGELKNTFCLLRDGEAILSQHLGDLENAAAHAACRETLDLYLDLFAHRPAVLAVDQHPDYLSSKMGIETAQNEGTALEHVQHHHAHVAACMADNGLDVDAPPVLGVALDGLGYGADGTIWGGELLLADYRGFRRLASLAPVPMPGGAQAIAEPWRMAFVHLDRLGDRRRLFPEFADLPFFRSVVDEPLETLSSMIESGFNSPLTSSCGRLFDAVAAVTGLRGRVSYEGQAAIELEAAVDRAALHDGLAYPFAVRERRHRKKRGDPAIPGAGPKPGSGVPAHRRPQAARTCSPAGAPGSIGAARTDDVGSDGLLLLEPRPMWRALLRDLREAVPIGVVAARFHAGLAQAVVDMIGRLAVVHGDAWGGRVALTGGVFQNAVFSELVIGRLEGRGLEVLRHRQVPANDGGLSLGQAAVAAARALSEG